MDTQTITAPAPTVPEIPAEVLETIPTRERRLPSSTETRVPQRGGKPSTFRGWTMGGRVD